MYALEFLSEAVLQRHGLLGEMQPGGICMEGVY